MADPATLAEYEARFAASHRFEGRGSATATVFPCPFCAAPGWATVLLVETAAGLTRARRCSECGRTGRCDVRTGNGATTVEVVLCGGPDAPAYLPPIRREGGDGG